MNKSFKVIVDIPEGVTNRDMKEYIYDAIRSHGGSYHPGDPLFTGNWDALSTKVSSLSDTSEEEGNNMSPEETLMRMFTAAYGEITGSCYIEFDYSPDNTNEILGINVMKNGNLCWAVSKLGILFDYTARNIKR